ncbi:MAG: peptidylprolyl isomerase, partial [Bacteroidota bacterium]|nr:peptidylprolyl isomerase [Bacteroidota bacterium]
NYTTKDSTGFILSESALWELLNSLTAEQKGQTIIKFTEGPATVKDILYYLMQEPLVIKEVNKRTIGYALKNTIDLFIEDELTARYGYKINAQNLPEVKKDLAIRKDNLLMQLYKLKLSDEIRLKLSKDIKTKKNTFNDISLHVCEILTSNLNLIDTVFNKLKNGTSFESLAKEYTVRTKPNNTGDLGFISPSEYGDIGKIASTLSIGQIYGPIKTKDGYSIFKLLDKKEITTSIDSDNNKMLSKVIDSQVEEEIQKYISKLASKENVAINKGALKSVEVSNINTLTYRLMGFGGRIIAEPFTYPMYEWVKYLNVPLF